MNNNPNTRKPWMSHGCFVAIRTLLLTGAVCTSAIIAAVMLGAGSRKLPTAMGVLIGEALILGLIGVAGVDAGPDDRMRLLTAAAITLLLTGVIIGVLVLWDAFVIGGS